MKILRVSPSLDPEMGGPQTTVVNAAIAEEEAGLLTTVAFTYSPESLHSTNLARSRLAAAGVEIRRFRRTRVLPASMAASWGVSGSLGLWLLANTRRYDVVHVDYVWAFSTVLATLAGRASRKPVVMTAHESLTGYGMRLRSGSEGPGATVRARLKSLMRRTLMRGVDVVVMTSDLELVDSFRAGERGVVVPHAVVDGSATPPGPEPPDEPFTVGYIGRLHPKKNLEILLRAAASMEPPRRIIVCGTGDPHYSSRLRRLADELSLGSCVEWRGHVDPAGRAELFAQSHVIAMPSAYECFGMAAAEAMAAGVPVIVSEKTGVAPVVREFECGLVVEAGSPDDLRIALVKVAEDKVWRGRARTNAARAASERYSYPAYGKRVRQEYAALLGSGQGEGAAPPS